MFFAVFYIFASADYIHRWINSLSTMETTFRGYFNGHREISMFKPVGYLSIVLPDIFYILAPSSGRFNPQPFGN